MFISVSEQIYACLFKLKWSIINELFVDFSRTFQVRINCGRKSFIFLNQTNIFHSLIFNSHDLTRKFALHQTLPWTCWGTQDSLFTQCAHLLTYMPVIRGCISFIVQVLIIFRSQFHLHLYYFMIIDIQFDIKQKCTHAI